MGNYGTRNAHPMTKEIKRENRKKHLAVRKLTKKQRAVHDQRLKLANNACPTIVDFIWIFQLLKVKIEVDTHYNYNGYSPTITNFAEEYIPFPEMPVKGNPKKERRHVR